MADIVVSAPGKVILHGEHSVVYGKVAVASSLNLRCFLRATFGEDDAVVVDLPDVSLYRQWSVSSIRKELLSHIEQNTDNGSPSAPSEKTFQVLRQFACVHGDSTRELALISFLYLYCCICGKEKEASELPQVHVRLISQLPVGAGLGSSAAFSVCLAAILLQLAGQIRHSGPSSQQEQGDSNSVNQVLCGWTEDEKLLINKWAFLGEKIIHGQPSGIDNSVSTLGGAIHFQNKVITPLDKMPPLQILLVNTKVSRSTKTLVANVRKRYEKFPEVLGPVLDAVNGLAERSIKAYGALYDKPTSQPVFSELEELINMNQHLLNSLGVGHPSLDTVVQITARHGLQSKLTGAGGGGCAYTLLTPDTSEDSIHKACQDLQEAGFDCWQTSVGAMGVCFHTDPRSDASIPPQLFT